MLPKTCNVDCITRKSKKTRIRWRSKWSHYLCCCYSFYFILLKLQNVVTHTWFMLVKVYAFEIIKLAW